MQAAKKQTWYVFKLILKTKRMHMQKYNKKF